jgi:hypothetical protein
MKYAVFICFFLGIVCNVNAQTFSVSYSAAVYNGPFTGNVLLYLSKKNELPKDHISYPCFRMEVQNIQPGQPVVFSDSSLSFPTILSRIDTGNYYVQAVWDLNIEGRTIGISIGNPFSDAQKISISHTAEHFTIVCDQKRPPFTFVETRFVKELKAPSTLLSKFHNKPITLNGAVILPKQYYDEQQRRFPVLFIVAGWGGPYIHYSSTESTDTLPATPIDTIPCIRIYLDGDCSLGHSVYANSDNNGPVGDAFIKEFIPALDKRFRTDGARFIKGHSSGGWTVVYLLTHYPKMFVAGNASCPDPVDFRRFTLTNLYLEDQRVEFVDGLTGVKKPTIKIEYDRPNIVRSVEDILYRGEQNGSFNAVFGPRGKNGLPKPLFDPVTFKKDEAVFEHWKQYDLTQFVIKNWSWLKKDMPGKLRISSANEDNAYLNFTAMLMEKEMKKLNADISFVYYPGNHFNVVTAQYKKDELLFFENKYLEWCKKQNKSTK